ncbi:MAG: SAM-dependent DNA methyltransferase [Rhodocyclaceae bacterium]|nr:SAM-dependent DNA methyltransferase [Rhodocyclaceae bacterium]
MTRSAAHRDITLEAVPAVAPALDRSVARLLAAAVAGESRLAFARSFTFGVARAYATALAALQPALEAPQNVPLIPLDVAAARAAAQFGTGLAHTTPMEAVYLLGCIYTSALPSDFRATHGVFYTPPEIVRHTLDMAERAGIDWRHARCLDPSAGGGAFLVEMIWRIRDALAGTDPAIILRQLATRVRGYDLDPFGAWLAQTAAHFAVHDLEIAVGRRLPAIVHVRDSLDLRPEDCGVFDLVSSNVPFGRVTLPPERRAIYARSTYGHANLYGLFTDAGLRYAKGRGVIAYVMPTSMLSGLYYQALRVLLAKEAPPHEITFVTERSGIFEDALQETMLAAYRKGRRTRIGTVRFVTIDARGPLASSDSNGEGTITIAGSFSLPADRTAPWLLPRTTDQADLAARLRGMKFRLASYGYGVSTGPLVWNRHKRQFRSKREAGVLPVIWAEAVTSDGRFIWRADKRNHELWFAPVPRKDDWLIVDHACVLLQRTTAKEQNRRLIAAVLPESFIAKHGGVIIENHLNMIRAAAGKPAVPPAVIAAILNSRAADAAFRCISGSVAVSAFELEAMPLPSPATMRKIARLLERRTSAATIERAIATAYGIVDAVTVA